MEFTPTNLFGRFVYSIPRDRLGPAITAKVEKLKTKIAERIIRIAKIRKDNDISDAVLVELLRLAESNKTNNTYYSVSNPSRRNGEQESPLVIGAGVLASLQAEEDAMEQEKKSVSRLERVERNLAYVKGECEVTYDELKFLDL